VLLQSSENNIWCEDDFTSFVFSGRDTPSQLILVWKQTEQEMLREFSASLKRQRSIIYESQRFEQSIWPELAIQKVNSKNTERSFI
jgi:hypothetical protein